LRQAVATLRHPLFDGIKPLSHELAAGRPATAPPHPHPHPRDAPSAGGERPVDGGITARPTSPALPGSSAGTGSATVPSKPPAAAGAPYGTTVASAMVPHPPPLTAAPIASKSPKKPRPLGLSAQVQQLGLDPSAAHIAMRNLQVVFVRCVCAVCGGCFPAGPCRPHCGICHGMALHGIVAFLPACAVFRGCCVLCFVCCGVLRLSSSQPPGGCDSACLVDLHLRARCAARLALATVCGRDGPRPRCVRGLLGLVAALGALWAASPWRTALAAASGVGTSVGSVPLATA
jgi:hypothetical protein